jgi:ADP-dependent NAD(P)H-hydrate dehydratase / NAD(P)H-hydrate epimerase
MMPARVTTAAQSAALDAAVIASGGPGTGYALMRAAGEGAARRIAALGAARRAAVYCGSGNNGGDGWVVAAALRAAGWLVTLQATGAPRSDDARRAREDALAQGGPFAAPSGDEPVCIDALLGTGASGPLRDALRAAVDALRAARARGATIIALDLPSGLDATTGEDHGAVPAHRTLTFGTVKRGLLLRRDLTGAIDVLAIGVERTAQADPSLPVLVDAAALAAVPRIPATAHKGTRGRVLIVGGAAGMAGAAVLAARAALRAGAGLVHTCVAPESVLALQTAVPSALALPWGAALPAVDALVLGPGLGAEARARVAQALAQCADAAVVLDADALNAFAGDLPALQRAVQGRRVVLTPHPGEAARLLGMTVPALLASRFDAAPALAAATGAVVLLKGTPSLIAAPDGRVQVAAVGSPVLATGGSGDLLAGLLGALLATGAAPMAMTAAAAWAHGAAAERVATTAVRGRTLEDVEAALAEGWQPQPAPLPEGVLAMLPAVGEC